MPHHLTILCKDLYPTPSSPSPPPPPPPVNTVTNSPSSLLFTCLRHKRWSSATHILNNIHSNKKLISSTTKLTHYSNLLLLYSNKHGVTPLHLAYRTSSTPLPLLQSLLSLTPPSALLTADDRGHTPLRLALEYATDDAILDTLDTLSTTTSKNNNIITREIIDRRTGSHPLHFAIRAEKSVKIYDALMTMDPAAVSVTDGRGRTPLDLYFGRWNSGLRAWVWEREKGGSRSWRRRSSSSPRREKELTRTIVYQRVSPRRARDVYEKISLLLSAATGCSRDNLLLSSIKHSGCPWSVTAFLLQLQPTHSLLTDEDDNLPLHVAASSTLKRYDGDLYHCDNCHNSFSKECWYQHRYHNHALYDQFCHACVTSGKVSDVDLCGGGGDGDYIATTSVNKMEATVTSLAKMAAVFPLERRDGSSGTIGSDAVGGARPTITMVSVPDGKGRLPLHLAMESGMSDDVTRLLFTMAPEAIRTRSVMNHMVPFMMAAVGGDNDDDANANAGIKRRSWRRKRRTETKKKNASLEQFTSCFAWLMEDPTMVHVGF